MRALVEKSIIILLIVFLVSCGTTEVNAAVKTYTQKEWCLTASDYSVVSNKNLYKKVYKYDYGSKSKRNIIKANKGNRKFNLKTIAFLPEYVKGKKAGNPQSMAIVGKYTYVLYTKKANSNTGWIVRYKTKNLTKKNASKVKKGMKVGKTFTTGHGQSLSYNPITKEFWVIKDMSTKSKPGAYATLQRINKKTLTPDAAIKFRLSSTVAMGHNLAFDSEGNAYFYTYVTSNGGRGNVGNVKIYKGSISTKKVEFTLLSQGLKHRPGDRGQGLGYDPKSNRLVIVSDGSISSVPIDKIGQLVPSDIKATQFKTKREFEAVEFDSKGYAYLLTNRGPEVLRSTKVPY